MPWSTLVRATSKTLASYWCSSYFLKMFPSIFHLHSQVCVLFIPYNFFSFFHIFIFQKNWRSELIFKTLPESFVVCFFSRKEQLWILKVNKSVSYNNTHPKSELTHKKIGQFFKNNDTVHFCNGLMWKRTFCYTKFKVYALLRDFL